MYMYVFRTSYERCENSFEQCRTISERRVTGFAYFLGRLLQIKFFEYSFLGNTFKNEIDGTDFGNSSKKKDLCYDLIIIAVILLRSSY